jgi:hypothetical protein
MSWPPASASPNQLLGGGLEKFSHAALAYGVPPHTFINFFQMSPQYARSVARNLTRQWNKSTWPSFWGSPLHQI